MTTPQRVEHQQTDKGSVPVYTTGVVEQPWDSYSETDHEVWRTLFRRQQAQLGQQACREFLDATAAMGMGETGIPRFSELNAILQATTGWQIIGVEGKLINQGKRLFAHSCLDIAAIFIHAVEL